MPFSDMTLADNAAIEQTFTATTNANLQASWKHQISGKPFSQWPSVTMKTRPSTSSMKRKVSLKVELPFVTNVDTGAVDYDTAHIDFLIPELAAETDVLDLISFVREALDETQIVSAIKSGVHPG